MLLQLQRYSFTLQYVPGSQLIVADTLSRACLPDKDDDAGHDKLLAAIADDEQMESLRMVASPATIDMIKSAGLPQPPTANISFYFAKYM